MSQFKRQRINPLPGGRNFSGDHLDPYLASYSEVCALELVFKNVTSGVSLVECNLLLMFLRKLGDDPHSRQ